MKEARLGTTRAASAARRRGGTAKPEKDGRGGPAKPERRGGSGGSSKAEQGARGAADGATPERGRGVASVGHAAAVFLGEMMLAARQPGTLGSGKHPNGNMKNSTDLRLELEALAERHLLEVAATRELEQETRALEQEVQRRAMVEMVHRSQITKLRTHCKDLLAQAEMTGRIIRNASAQNAGLMGACQRRLRRRRPRPLTLSALPPQMTSARRWFRRRRWSGARCALRRGFRASRRGAADLGAFSGCEGAG